MFCKTCGQEVNDNAVICPHCGCTIKQTTETNPQQKMRKINVLCLVGFILSLVSLFISLYCTIPIAALVLSIVGVVQASKRGDGLRGLGIAGIVLSGISVILCIILLVYGLSLL